MPTVDDLFKMEEGFRGTLYDDATGKPIVPGWTVIGHPTAGWGFALDTCPLDQVEADFIFARRLARATAAAIIDLGAADWKRLDDVRRAALTSMAYQMGAAGLAAFKNTLAAVRAGNWQAARDGVMASDFAKETPGRAGRDATMLLTGEWPAGLAKA